MRTGEHVLLILITLAGAWSVLVGFIPITPTRPWPDAATHLLKDAMEQADPPRAVWFMGQGLAPSQTPYDWPDAIASLRPMWVLEGAPPPLHERIWVLAREHSWPKEPAGFRSTTLGTHDGWRLDLWEAPDTFSRLSLAQHWSRRFMARYVPDRGRQGDTVTCSTWRFGQRFCGPDPWLAVGLLRTLVARTLTPCFWAHPREGYTLEITFPDVPLAKPLRARYALSDHAAAFGEGAPVEVTFRAGDAKPITRNLVNRMGWQRLTLPTSPNREPVDLTISITSDKAARRHVCFDGDIVLH